MEYLHNHIVEKIAVAFILCAYGEGRSQSVADIIDRILKQFLSQNGIPKAVEELYEVRSQGLQRSKPLPPHLQTFNFKSFMGLFAISSVAETALKSHPGSWVTLFTAPSLFYYFFAVALYSLWTMIREGYASSMWHLTCAILNAYICF